MRPRAPDGGGVRSALAELHPPLQRRLLPWVDAIEHAEVGAPDRLREAAQDTCTFLLRTVALTAQMQRALVEARGATTGLTAAIETPGCLSFDGALEGASEAMVVLLWALRDAELSDTAGAIKRIW